MSKCDFRIDFSSRMVSLPPDFQSKLRFNVELPRGQQFELASSKCDWQVSVGSVRVEGVADRMRGLKAQLPGGALRVSSDKCDWTVSISPVRAGAATQPTIQARMASDKCDFAVNLRLGLDRGQTYRLAAAASAKCDFSLGELQVFDPAAKTWRAAGANPGNKRPK